MNLIVKIIDLMSNTWLEIPRKMTRGDLFDNYEDAICELCKRNGHHRSTPCGECEGAWCEVSQDCFAIENNIELID